MDEPWQGGQRFLWTYVAAYITPASLCGSILQRGERRYPFLLLGYSHSSRREASSFGVVDRNEQHRDRRRRRRRRRVKATTSEYKIRKDAREKKLTRARKRKKPCRENSSSSGEKKNEKSAAYYASAYISTARAFRE